VTKRVTVVAAISLFAALAVPSVAFAQDHQGSSGEPSVTGGSAGSEQEGSTPPESVTPEPSVLSEQTDQEVTSGTTEEPETDAIEPQVASSDAGSAVDASSADTSTPVASTSLATVTGTNKIRTKKASTKGKKAKRSCASSSRAGGPLAQASAPPAAGCTRMNGNNGVLIAPDGTTLTITETSQGVIDVTVSNAPGGAYSGTLFVKGGPDALGPGNPCVFNAVPNGATQTCTGNVNPNNGKFYGVSHVDACPPGVTPVPPGTTPGGSDGSRGRGGGQRREQKKKKKKAAAESVARAPAAAAAVPAPAGLPVTGLPVVWLVLVGGGLLASGLTLRRLS